MLSLIAQGLSIGLNPKWLEHFKMALAREAEKEDRMNNATLSSREGDN